MAKIVIDLSTYIDYITSIQECLGRAHNELNYTPLLDETRTRIAMLKGRIQGDVNHLDRVYERWTRPNRHCEPDYEAIAAEQDERSAIRRENR